jgi:glucosylceramidase
MKIFISVILEGLLFLSNTCFAQRIQVVTTSADGARLTTQPELYFQPDTVPLGDPLLVLKQDEILVNPLWKYQRIDGFGASFLEAGMICANTLNRQERDRLFQSLFDTVSGAGFSIMKSPLAGNDFMSAGGWYSYNDSAGDTGMKHFSIDRDLQPAGLISYIREAKKFGHFLLQAPMDYPPDWMLTSASDPARQDVDEKYFPALAKYYLRYLQEYKRQGINIDYLSLFNEPGIYTKMPYAKMSILLADYVGPLLAKNKIRTIIQLCEANQRIRAWNFYPEILQNKKAALYIGGLAFHGYDYQRNFDKIADLKQRYPQWPIWMTEVCHAYVCGYPRSKPLPNYDYDDGDYWGNEIISDLESGVSGWIYWNMILDERGGPWLVSENHGDPDRNAQHPVVVVNRSDKTIHYTALYYYLTHFSRYVRPGSIRIGSYENIDGLRAIAFLRPDNQIVLQILNSSLDEKTVRIRWKNRQAAITFKPGSMNTLMWGSEMK